MSGKPRPSPCILDGLEVIRIMSRRKVWRSADGTRLFTWDSLHGEVEVFTAKGNHIGAIHPVTGKFIKEAVKGRKLK